MATSFNCPNCGGQNVYDGMGNTTICTFCGSEISVPPNMVDEAAANIFRARAKTWVIIFIIVVFVVPLCISIGGGLIGFLATIFSAIVTIFASFFGH